MNLILFFNGWGMDERIFKDFPNLKNFQINIINYPYNVPLLNFEKHDKIYVIGWSFGVYYASLFLKNFPYDYIGISINGTPETIGSNGITPKIFDLTLNTLNKENLLKFYENMEVKAPFLNMDKSIEELKESLLHLKNNYVPQENYFHFSYIGERDKIIPASRQNKYYKNKNIPIFNISCGHYPFYILNSWDKILKDVTNEI